MLHMIKNMEKGRNSSQLQDFVSASSSAKSCWQFIQRARSKVTPMRQMTAQTHQRSTYTKAPGLGLHGVLQVTAQNSARLLAWARGHLRLFFRPKEPRRSFWHPIDLPPSSSVLKTHKSVTTNISLTANQSLHFGERFKTTHLFKIILNVCKTQLNYFFGKLIHYLTKY